MRKDNEEGGDQRETTIMDGDLMVASKVMWERRAGEKGDGNVVGKLEGEEEEEEALALAGGEFFST